MEGWVGLVIATEIVTITTINTIDSLCSQFLKKQIIEFSTDLQFS